MSTLEKVAIVGSGNWGSCIAKIVGNNITSLDNYADEVKMWVFEEEINGKKLTEIINSLHENVKYLPGIKLPKNVVANSNLIDVCHDANILIFVLPHQFLPRVLAQIKDKIRKDAYAITLIKGFDIDEKSHGIRLISDAIRSTLNIPCAALMGANLAPEVARELFCEATVGCRDVKTGEKLKKLFHTDYFRIVVCKDEVGVELCGALKNVVACGSAFAEGLGYGANTTAAIIRLGFKEIMKFIDVFYKERGICQETYLESCGIADLITTCAGGRNRKVAMEFVKGGKTISELEKELLDGQSAQGPLTAREVNVMLKARGLEDQFPLLTAVHKICEGLIEPIEFINCLRNHPEHM